MAIPIELALIAAVVVSTTAYKLGYDRGYDRGSHQEMLTWLRLLCSDRTDTGRTEHDHW